MSSVVPAAKALGSRELYETLFREVFAATAVVRESDVRAYCLAKIYRAGSQLDGALQLLTNIDVLVSEGDCLRQGIYFKPIAHSPDLGLSIAERLITRLTDTGELGAIFCTGSLSWGSSHGEIYVHLSQVPFQYLSAMQLLRELGALNEMEDSVPLLRATTPISDLLVNSAFDAAVKQRRRGQMSPKELERLQAAQAEQGEIAEEFALDYERRRLHGHPRPELIRRISLDDVSAGYDIISFESAKSLLPDRFIEVKSFRGEERFFWSSGETKSAEELKDTYFLYLVDVERSGLSGYTPQIIRNPFSEIFAQDSCWVVNTASMEVSRKSGI